MPNKALHLTDNRPGSSTIESFANAYEHLSSPAGELGR